MHSPAPWTVCRTKLEGAITHWHITDAKHGSVYPVCSHTLESEPDCSEQLANANLIAAAPDMLSVLLDLKESASYWSEYDVPIGIVDRINFAIAKATVMEG